MVVQQPMEQVLASLAASRTDRLEASGEDPLAALNGGYHVAYVVGAVFVVVSAVVGALLLRSEPGLAAHGHGEVEAAPEAAR